MGKEDLQRKAENVDEWRATALTELIQHSPVNTVAISKHSLNMFLIDILTENMHVLLI